MVRPDSGERQVPIRALIVSLLALFVPVVGALAFPGAMGDAGALLWLVLLIPAFLLAYYRGWRGAATALAAGMATLSITQAVANYLAVEMPDLLFGIVVAYLGITMGIGWMAEILHRDRETVEDMAFTDILTRLPNRRHTQVFLENEYAAAERGRLLAVVLFDIDNFKGYNDRYGHQAGDEALVAFAEVLHRTTRRMNLAGRFGGEEFMAVLAGSDAPGAMVFADRVRLALRSLELGDGPLTVSAGVAAYYPGMRSPDELVAAADRALYQAKSEGRNCVRRFGALDADGQAGMAGTDRDTTDADSQTTSLPPHAITAFGTGRTCMVVEDDPQVLGLLVDYLTREGFSVQPAEDGAVAIRALSQEFDVVITDLRLPEASGHEVVTAAKSRHPATQVIVISGLQDAHRAAEALQAGADRYLFKPFGMPELRANLADALVRRDRELGEASRRRALTAEGELRASEARESILRGTRALMAAVEAKDPFTSGHSDRVSTYTELLAEALDPTGVRLPREMLRLACEVHDVGKLGVPDGVLNKNGPLTAEEYAEVKEHPRIGKRILSALIDDPLVLAVTGWHHERWDGEGYPDGLHGEAIPLAARVVGLADALSALTHPRPWRDAVPWEEAIEVLRRDSGTAFDPDILDAMDRCLPSLRAAYQDFS